MEEHWDVVRQPDVPTAGEAQGPGDSGAGRPRGGRGAGLLVLAVVAALVVGVLLARGTTAVDEDFLARPAPTASAAPELASSGVRLEANGLPGLRLGAGPRGIVPMEGPHGSDSPAGCVAGFADGSLSTGLAAVTTTAEVSVWLVDDVVASVSVLGWEVERQAVPEVATWLGVGLGSPIEQAAALDGARTTREQPFGADGPTTTVVRVPLPGGGSDLVLSDAVSGPRSPGTRDGGVVTTLEVRTAAGRECDADDMGWWFSPPGEGVEPVAVSADGGVGGVAVRDRLDDLVAAGHLADPGPAPADGSCAWVDVADGRLVATVRDGVVVALHVGGPFRHASGITHDTSLAELLQPPYVDLLAGDVDPEVLRAGLTDGAWPPELELDLGDGTTARLWLNPEQALVPDVDRPVSGPTLRVAGISLHAADLAPVDGC